MLAASWPTPCIAGPNLFHPSFLIPPPSLFTRFGLLCVLNRAEFVGVLSSTDVFASYLYSLMGGRGFKQSTMLQPDLHTSPARGLVEIKK